MRDVGRRIAELRSDRGLTQEQLAEDLGVSVNYVQGVEGGRENLSLTSLAKWSKALQVSAMDLLSPPSTRSARPGRPRKR